MIDAFKIYVDQLRNGNDEEIQEEFSPAFLNVNEKELSFADPIEVNGHAYLTDDSLILNLAIKTKAMIPCSICNEPFKFDIEISNFYHVEELEEIKGAVYDFQELLRETILLETPQFAECHQGKCPDREKIKNYLKEVSEEKKSSEEDGYQPFSDFDWNKKD